MALPPYMGTRAGGSATTASTQAKAKKASGGSANFNKAFAEARKAGKAKFSFGGKSYTTELAAPKKPAAKTATAPATVKKPKPLVTLDRQGQLQPATGRNAAGKKVAATKEPAGAAPGRTYFDRPTPSAAAKAKATAALDRSTKKPGIGGFLTKTFGGYQSKKATP